MSEGHFYIKIVVDRARGFLVTLKASLLVVDYLWRNVGVYSMLVDYVLQ